MRKKREKATQRELHGDEHQNRSEEEYEVECIVKSRKSVKGDYPKHREDGQRCMEYFVKWKGWDASTNTWEHESELGACTKLIEAFWRKVEKEREQRKRKRSNRTDGTDSNELESMDDHEEKSDDAMPAADPERAPNRTPPYEGIHTPAENKPLLRRRRKNKHKHGIVYLSVCMFVFFFIYH